MNEKRFNRLFWKYLILGFTLCFFVCLFLFGYETIFKKISNWVGDIPNLTMKILFFLSFKFVGVSLLFGVFIASLFTFREMGDDFIKFKKFFRKQLISISVLVFLLFCFNNWILPKIEIHGFLNTYYLVSTDKETGKIQTDFLNSPQALLSHPNSYNIQELNLYIDSLQLDNQKEIVKIVSMMRLLPEATARAMYEKHNLEKIGIDFPKNITNKRIQTDADYTHFALGGTISYLEQDLKQTNKYIYKNSERIIQPFLLYVYFLFGCLTSLFIRKINKLLLILLAIIQFSISYKLFEYFSNIEYWNKFNINLFSLFLVVVLAILIFVLIFIKIKHNLQLKNPA